MAPQALLINAKTSLRAALPPKAKNLEREEQVLEILRKAPRNMYSRTLVGTEMYCLNKDTIMCFPK